jgi:hypothetical protein
VVKSKFTNVLEYFGEEADMSADKFFDTLAKFLKEFSDTRATVERIRRQEMKAMAASAPPLAAGKKDVSTTSSAASTPRNNESQREQQSLTRSEEIASIEEVTNRRSSIDIKIPTSGKVKTAKKPD